MMLRYKILLVFYFFSLTLVSHAEEDKPQAFFNSGDSGVFHDLQSGELLKPIVNDKKTYYLEQDGDMFEEDVATIDTAIQGFRSESYSFSKSKRLLATQVYPKHQIAFYSGCRYKVKEKKLIPIHSSCGFTYRKNEKRSQRIEWEHVVPAWLFGHQLRCWQQGGRLNCRNNNATFKQMEADMHNLVPAIGEINGDRSNYKYGIISGEQRLYGKPDMEISFPDRMAEPPASVVGDIARTYFYMVDKYDLKISSQQTKLFIAWNNMDPVDDWEREKNKRLKTVQGDENLYVTHYKKLKQGDVVDSSAGDTFAEIKTELEPIFAFLYGYLPEWLVNSLLFLAVVVVWWYRRSKKKGSETKSSQKTAKPTKKGKKKEVVVAKVGVLANAIKANKAYTLQPQLTNKLLSLDDDNKAVIAIKKNKINTQSWQLIPTNKQEGYVFIQKAGTNQVLEIEGAEVKDGTRVILATRKRRSNDHQEWMLIPLAEDSHWHFMQNRATQTVLDVAYKKTKEGTSVVGYHKKIRGCENQLWLMTED